MFLEIFGFVLFGVAGGLFTGLVPGIHTNTLCMLLLSIFPLILKHGIQIHSIVSFIISMAVTHTVTNFIPSILLGAPDDSTALSILPGHRLLLEGKGLEAIYLTVIGGIGVMILFVIFLPFLLKFLPVIYGMIKHYIHFFLIGIAFIMIFIEKGLKGKFFGLVTFFLAGILGLIVLDSLVLPTSEMFFPLFTGLFGISTLLISLNKKARIPKQEKENLNIDRKIAIFGSLKAFFSGLIVGILPGVGSAQATVLSQIITKRKDDKEFLVSVGGINTAVALFSLVSLYAIGRPRSGAAVTIERILGNFGFNELILLISTSLIAISIASILTLNLSRKFLSLIEKVPYDKLSLGIIILLISLTLFFTGFLGLLVLFVSTCIGIIAPLSGVKRSLCMGVLIVPVSLFYAGFV